MRRVSVVFVPVQGEPEIRSIPATLEAQQALVGGLIQPLPLSAMRRRAKFPGLDEISIVVNEEGRLINLPINLWLAPWGALLGPVYFARWNNSALFEIVDLDFTDVENIARLLAEVRP